MHMNMGRMAGRATSPLWRVLLPVVACFVAGSSILFVEFFLRDCGAIKSSLTLALLGFAATWSLVIGVCIAVGSFFGQALKDPRFSAKSGKSLWYCLLVSLPVWPVWWWLSQQLFLGGWAQRHDLAGYAPLVVCFVLILMSIFLVRSWHFTWSSHPAKSIGLLLIFVGVAFTVDAFVYQGLYLFLHQVLGVATLFGSTLVVMSILNPLGSSSAAVRLFFLGFFAVLFLSLFHVFFLFEGGSSQRLLIFEKLTATKSLCRLVPYRRTFEEWDAPIALSTRSTQWAKERKHARTLFQGQRGDMPLNLLIVSIDAVRRDHTTLHGYARNTTPFLAELAKTSVVFEDARSPSTSSFFSLMSLLSGSYPSSISQRRGQDPDLLGRALKSIGVVSTGIYTDSVFTARPNDWPKPDLRLGQDHYIFSEEKSEVMVHQVLDVFSSSSEPIFVLTHLMDPHFPYEHHEEFDFGDAELDAYDSEIAQADSQLRVLLEGLKDQGLLDSTVVVVTSDHGEAFGEHGAFLHGGVPFEEQCRVPLLIRIPQFAQGRRIQGSVSLTSLGPTLVDIMGCRDLLDSEAPSLLPLIMGQSDPRDYYAVVERPSFLDRQSFPSVSALVRGAHKIRHHLDSDLHLVFDLEKDPLEIVDVTESRPQLARTMGQLYREWREDCIFRRGPGAQIGAQFASLRDDILLDRDQRISELSTFLRRGSLQQRGLAAEMMFDLEMRGKIDHQIGLGAQDENGLSVRALGLRDLLNAKQERRPFYEATTLCGSSNNSDRERAAEVLWHLAILPFARDLVVKRLQTEKNARVRGDLLAARAKFDATVEPEELLDAAKRLSGPVATRLIISLMSLNSEATDDLIERTLRSADTPLSHVMIEHLGAVDSPYRRGVVRRLLRLDRYTIRTTAVHSLRHFPRSKWLIGMLCQVVRHEGGRSIRIDAAKQLTAHGGTPAAVAMLEALVAYPKSSLSLGYLLASRFPNELWNWQEKKLELREKTFVGKRHELKLPAIIQNDELSRRLLVTVVRQVKPRNIDDHITIEDATGRILFDQICRGRTSLINYDIMAQKSPVAWPLFVSIVSPSRKQGEHIGLILVSLFNLKTKLDLWPSQANSLSMPFVLQRMTGDWITTMEDADSCFLPEGSGSLVLVGDGIDHNIVEIEITTPGIPCILEVRLWGHVLGNVELKEGKRRMKIVFDGLKGKYIRSGTNRFSFNLVSKKNSLLSQVNTKNLMALWSLKLK